MTCRAPPPRARRESEHVSSQQMTCGSPPCRLRPLQPVSPDNQAGNGHVHTLGLTLCTSHVSLFACLRRQHVVASLKNQQKRCAVPRLRLHYLSTPCRSPAHGQQTCHKVPQIFEHKLYLFWLEEQLITPQSFCICVFN